MENEIWLGLDISTACIGVAMVMDDGSDDGKLVELTHIIPKTPKKVKGVEMLFLKKRIFEDEFIQKYSHYNIKHVVIESPLLRSNNAVTCSTLLMFNGMISECMYRAFGVVPEYISSYEAREFAFPELMAVRKYNKKEEQYGYKKIMSDIENGKLVLFGSYPWTIDKKTVIQDKVSERFPDVEWVLDDKGELKKENFDVCDAYVAVKGHMNKMRHGKLEFETDVIGESNDGNGNMSIDYTVRYWGREERRTTYVKV